MSSCSRRPKPSLKRGESSSLAEDWQLRILWEWQQAQKQPPSHPSLEQRRLLAAQTGLNIKWISSWFKKDNGVSKKKRPGTAAKNALSEPPIVAEATHGPGPPKLAGLAEAILPSSMASDPPGATEDPFLFCQSDIGVNEVSESVRSDIPRKKDSSTRELSGGGGGGDLVLLVPDLDLQTSRDHPLVLCSSSHAARLVQVSESPSALLHPPRTVDACGTSLGHDFASPLQLSSSPGSLLSGTQPPSSCGSHSPHESVETHHFHATLGGSQSVGPAYPKYTAHDSRPAASESACIVHPDSSVPTLLVASQPSLVPLPSIYWLLFDTDEHCIGGRNDALRGAPLSPPGGELCGPGVAAASQASATPVSFLAKWEDILTLERNVRSSLVKNLSRARQAQSPEVTPIEQSGLETSLTPGRIALTYLSRNANE